jgi:hypothetical protein
MSIATMAPPDVHGSQAPASETLTSEQAFALERLQLVLDRRDAVDAGRLSPPEDSAWLVRALDAAIVSYYRLARGLGVAMEADEFLHGYREMGLGSAE